MAAESMLLMATPASTRVMRLAPVLRARVYTSIHAPSAPRKAATGTAVIEVGIRAAQRDCPQACAGIHPDDIGPRQGLPSTPWMMTPPTARALPHSRAARVRGRRA